MTTEAIEKKEPKQYSIFPLLIIIAVVFGAYSYLNAPATQPEQSVKADLTNNRMDAKAHYNSQAEPTTQYANWVGDDIFVVAVIDDKSNRNGYAQSVCYTLNDFGFANESIKVQVIEAKSNKHNLLGNAQCK